jgi:hemerythrin superfamily protein
MAMNQMDMGEMMPDESMGMQMGEMEQPAQNPIEIIKGDHRKVESLFEQFEGTEDKKQKFELSKQVCMELTVHAQVEEELVYPLLKKEDEDVEEEAELEHELIKFMISQIESGSGARDKTLDPKMKVLKELVQHHVEEEESDALPELEGNEELMGMTQKILDMKTKLMDKLMKKGGKSGAMRKTAARSSSGGRKTASTSKSKSKSGSSTRAKKSAAGKKGATSRSKSTTGRKSASTTKKSTTKKSTSTRGKSTARGGTKKKSTSTRRK